MFEQLRQQLRRADWIYVLLIFILLIVNLVVLYSASSNIISDNPYFYLKKQLTWIALGGIVFFVAAIFDYHRLSKFVRPLYGLIFISLAGVLLMPEQKGAHRWYDLGFMDFQPSELAKIILIITFAYLLSNWREEVNQPKNLLKSFLLMGIPIGLILIEPDLGTAIICSFFFFVLLYVGGVKHKTIMILLLIIVICVCGLFGFLYHVTDGFQNKIEESDIPSWMPMQSYQLTRLIIFINPYMDPLDSGYHMIQSQVAIGSGGLLGKGLGKGTQVQGDFLPEHHTDFIFSVVGEETGFVGVVCILALYLALILRCLKIASAAKEKFGSLICIGITSVLFFQVFINVGMTIGLMPITGIPMPMLSYGGSSMLFNLLSLGIVLSVDIHSEKGIF